MRTVSYSDLTVAARALLSVPPSERPKLCSRILCEADWADRYVRKLGRRHPAWGNGTVVAAANSRALAPERSVSDPEYRDCLMIVLQGLSECRGVRMSD